jgi:acetyl-CoA C-acetyltransferase
VIVAGARTPVGRFQGALSRLTAVDLGATAIRAALARSGIHGSDTDYVLMGHVIQAGAGQNTARQAAVAADIPVEVPAVTVNKVCLSGMATITTADQMIRAGEIEVAVAGGMESMSLAPFVLPQARAGARLGDTPMIDAMINDGLWSSFTDSHMGAGTDEISAELGVGREEQDAWAARSHTRAAAAWDAGALEDEVATVEVAQRRGDPLVVARDEGIRPDTTPEVLGRLRSSFSAEGTVTAGNASQISDGAAAVVVMSAERAEALGLTPLAEIVSAGMAAGRFPSLHTMPALALGRAVERAGLGIEDLDLIEINEAFAAVPVHSTRMLGVGEDLVNVNGGAIALGHPIGASGTRIVLTLAHEMARRDVDLGGAAICGGGGQGDAIVLRRPR